MSNGSSYAVLHRPPLPDPNNTFSVERTPPRQATIASLKRTTAQQTGQRPNADYIGYPPPRRGPLSDMTTQKSNRSSNAAPSSISGALVSSVGSSSSWLTSDENLTPNTKKVLKVDTLSATNALSQATSPPATFATPDEALVMLADALNSRKGRRDALLRVVWQFIIEFRQARRKLTGQLPKETKRPSCKSMAHAPSKNLGLANRGSAVCNSRAVYRELLAASTSQKKLDELEATMDSAALGSLPSTAFVVAKAVLDASTAIVFLRALRYSTAMSKELSSIASDRYIFFRKRRIFRALRNETVWVKANRRRLTTMVGSILMRAIVSRRKASLFVRQFMERLRHRIEARTALRHRTLGLAFQRWHQSMKQRRLSATLYEYAKGHQSSSLLKLIHKPTKAVTSIAEVNSSINSVAMFNAVKYAGATPLTLGVPPLRAEKGDTHPTVFPKEFLVKSSAAPFSDPLRHTTDRHRLLLKRVVWTQWRHALQARRNDGEAALVARLALMGRAFSRWHMRFSHKPRSLAPPQPSLQVITHKVGVLASLTDAHLDKMADRMYYVRLQHTTYEKWRQRHLMHVAHRHRNHGIAKFTLRIWLTKTQEKRAHLKVKQFVFDHWKGKLERFRQRQLAHTWHRSTVAVSVLRHWRQEAVVASFHTSRVKRHVMAKWLEELKICRIRTMLDEEKLRRHFVAWKALSVSQKARKGQMMFAMGVSRKLQMLRCLNRWAARWRAAVRGRVASSIQATMWLQKVRARCFYKWLSQYRIVVDSRLLHQLRKRDEMLGINSSTLDDQPRRPLDDECATAPLGEFSSLGLLDSYSAPPSQPETIWTQASSGVASSMPMENHPSSCFMCGTEMHADALKTEQIERSAAKKTGRRAKSAMHRKRSTSTRTSSKAPPIDARINKTRPFR